MILYLLVYTFKVLPVFLEDMDKVGYTLSFHIWIVLISWNRAWLCQILIKYVLNEFVNKYFIILTFTGSIWSLVGAMLYAVYIVMIKRKVDREDKLDIPMFFGKNMFNLLRLCTLNN